MRKIATGQGDDYTIGCLLDNNCFKNYHKTDLSKQQALDADPNANLEQDGNTTMFFIFEEAKETILGFLQGTVKALRTYFTLI